MVMNPPALMPVFQSVFRNASTSELTPVVMAPALIPTILLTFCPQAEPARTTPARIAAPARKDLVRQAFLPLVSMLQSLPSSHSLVRAVSFSCSVLFCRAILLLFGPSSFPDTTKKAGRPGPDRTENSRTSQKRMRVAGGAGESADRRLSGGRAPEVGADSAIQPHFGPDTRTVGLLKKGGFALSTRSAAVYGQEEA